VVVDRSVEPCSGHVVVAVCGGDTTLKRRGSRRTGALRCSADRRAADLPRWLAWYNHHRPHAALCGSPPADCPPRH